MGITICGAPGCWGIEDINNPNNLNWKQVLKEASLAGYGAIELGPYGYLPIDATIVSEELKKNNLSIVAGTIFQNLLDPENLDYVLSLVDDICSVITDPKLPKLTTEKGQKFPAPFLTVMDWYHPERDNLSGHFNEAPRLSQKQYEIFIKNITAVCNRANKWGVRPTIHPHAGGYIEFEDEIEKIVNDIPYSVAGLCLDTGHLYYSGMNPSEILTKYKDRLDYVHFKDVNEKIFRKVLQEKIPFFDGCAKGTMCPIGKGSLDYVDIRNVLESINYHGYITIEQERDPSNSDTTLEDVKSSVDYLKNNGYKI